VSAQKTVYLAHMVILMLFSPQGRHAAPIGVKFCVMESTKVNSMTDIPKATSPMPNFTPIGALVACGGQKNWKCYRIFTKFWNINFLHRRIPCTIFTKFSRNVDSFMLAQVVKFGGVLSKSFLSYRGLNLRGFIAHSSYLSSFTTTLTSGLSG